jgi:aspartyl-tRNA(Asn)/glutamyl-tRNA(Gln) amidotransferase subunit C
MPITREAIESLAHLARLGVENTQDDASIQGDLSRIVAMVDQISAANTEGIEPMAHPLDTTQRLRSDVVTESNERDQLLALAPKAEAGLFLVPQVIE